MTVCLSVFIPINHLTILSSIAIAGGLYFFFFGFHLLARKRLLLSIPTAKIRSAALGLVEVNGRATGPYTMPAPITGQPCFLYRTVAWRQRRGKQEWEKVADETLHVPFFIDDSTGQLLIEPFGADLELHRDFHEEYDQPFLGPGLETIPPCISAFLSRHGIASGHRLRVEERTIKPEDPLFVAGTITENPGVKVHPLSPHGNLPSDLGHEVRNSERHNDSPRNTWPEDFLEGVGAPQVIRLASGEAATCSQQMGQQAKIAAALTRAGITQPEAWSAAGIPYPGRTGEENTLAAAISPGCDALVNEEQSASSRFHLTPPVVLMKGTKNPMFVISFRSQKEFARALAWKSAAMVCGGTAITLLGLYMLLAQMALV